MSMYREEILDHYKHPRNFGALERATVRVEEENMPCGDRMALALRIKDAIIEDARFTGTGCAVSIACMSMLTESVKNNTIEHVETLRESDILTFVGGTVAPGRMNCVLLGWKALKRAMRENELNHPSAHNDGNANASVTRDMNLGEVAARWPAARSVLLDYGLHCVGCFASSFDTIEAGAKVHGMSEEEIEEMVQEINRAIRNSGTKNKESKKSHS